MNRRRISRPSDKSKDSVYRESEFCQLLKELTSRDRSHLVDRFRLEFDRVFKRYVKSGRNDSRLVIQLHKLKQEIKTKATQNSRYVTDITETKSELRRLSLEETHLLGEYERSTSKTGRITRQSDRLEKQLENLHERLLEGIGFGRNSERLIQDLERRKLELLRESKKRENELNLLLRTQDELTNAVAELSTVRDTLNSDKTDLSDSLIRIDQTIHQYGQDSILLAQDISNLRNRIAKHRVGISTLRNELTMERNTEIGVQEERERRVQGIKDALVNAILAKGKLDRIKKELRMRLGENSILEIQKNEIAMEIEEYEDQESKIKAESQLLHEQGIRMKKRLQEEAQGIQSELARKKRIQAQLSDEKLMLVELQSQIESGKLDLDHVRNQQKLVAGRTEVLRRRTADVATQIQVTDATRRNLEVEVKEFRNESQGLFREVVGVHKDIRRFQNEIQQAETQVMLAQENLAIAKGVNQELRQQIRSEQARAKEFSNLISTVSTDRNVMRREFQVLCTNALIAQTKFRQHQRSIEVSKKEMRLLDEKVISEKEEIALGKQTLLSLTLDLEALGATINRNRTMEKAAYREVLRLKGVIGATDRERSRQVKELGSITNDRDMLGTQLVRRNQELSDLVQKINHQRSLLHKGQAMVQAHDDEIVLLQAKLRQSEKKLVDLQERMQDHSGLKAEVNALRERLLTENQRVAALVREREIRLNVHPWRVGDENTEIHRLVLEKRELQRSLDALRQDIMRRDLELQERESLYLELKNVVRKQPGEEDAELRRVLRETLTRKKKQIAAMNQRLQDSRDELKREEVACLQAEMGVQNVKKKWLS